MKNSSLPKITTKTYEIDKVKIEVNYQIIKDNKNPDNLIIILPGWSLGADTKSSQIIGEAFAEIGNRKVLIIDTKPDKIVEDLLFKEAEAISRLIEEMNIKNLIIAGYSEGGIKTVDLTTILQEKQDIKIEGIILMDSMGLYDQDSKQKLIGGFIKDTFIDTPLTIGKKVLIKKDVRIIKTGLQMGTDIIFGMLKEIKRSSIKYPQRILSQINDMFYKSERLKDVRVPVILIQGMNDPVSNPKKLIPELDTFNEKAERHMRGVHDPQREQFLKENVFPNSPYIRLLVGRKSIPHHVMPIEDAERIAKASIYLIGKANNII